MATLDSQSLLDLYAPTNGTPAGFTMAGNALQRGQVTENQGITQGRLEEDLGLSLMDLANSQAARGAFSSGATQRKGQGLGRQFGRSSGDLARGTAYSLASLGMSDIGASIPGVSF